MTIEGFKTKWGVLTPSIIVGELIQRAKKGKESAALEKKVDEMMEDLTNVLED